MKCATQSENTPVWRIMRLDNLHYLKYCGIIAKFDMLTMANVTTFA
jgi:hypothetical protein